MAPEPDRLREFARRYTEAWCSQDPKRVAAHYAPDGALTINEGSPSVGRAAITEAARSFMVAFPDMKVLMDDLVLLGEPPSITGRLSGRTPVRAEQGRASGSKASRSGRSATTG